MQMKWMHNCISWCWSPYKHIEGVTLLLMIFRLYSSLIIISFGIVLAVGPNVSPVSFYVSKFDGYSSDITSGILNYLKNSVEQFGSTSINNGVGLTTAEILILSDYTIEKVKNNPQFVTIGLLDECSVDFDTIKYEDSLGNVSFNKSSSMTASCQRFNNRYVFDYKQTVKDLGLGIVLSFASSDDGDSSSSNDSAYTKFIHSAQNKKEAALYLIYVVTALEAVQLAFSLWYYKIRGKYLNTAKEKVLLQLVSTISFTCFVCGAVSVITFVWLNLTLRRRIVSDLGSFGFKLELGKSWFGCLSVFGLHLLVSCFMWSGVEWCVTNKSPISQIDDTDKQTILNFQTGVMVNIEDAASQIQNKEKTLKAATPRKEKFLSPGFKVTEWASDEEMEAIELQDLTRWSSAGSDNLEKSKPLQPPSAMLF